MPEAPRARNWPLGLLAGLVLAAGAGGYWLGTRSDAAATLVSPSGGATITQALANAKPGDLIRLAPGVYREQLVLRDQVSVAAWGGDVEIQAPAGMKGALIQATGVRARLSGLRLDASAARLALSVRDGDIALEDLDVTGGTEAAIEFSGKAHVTLAASRLRSQGAGMVIRDSAEVRIERTVFTPLRKKQTQPALIIESARLPELAGNWFLDFPEPIWSALEMETRALDGNTFLPEPKALVRTIKRGAP